MKKLTALSASLATLVGGAALLSSAAVVHAGEPPQTYSKGPAPVVHTYVAPNWSGFVFGAYAGAGMTDPTLNPHQALQDRFEDPGYNSAGGGVDLLSKDADFAFELDDNGAMITGGGSLGYFGQFGMFVLGVEGDVGSVYSESEKENALATTVHYRNHDLGQSATITDYNQTSEADRAERFSSSLSMGAEASVRGTVGVAFGRLMVYGTGGWAAAKVDGNLNYTSRTDYFHDDIDNQENDETDGDIMRHTSTASDSWSEWVDGWTAGAGFEYLATERVSFGFEYRYADYGTQSRTLAVTRTATKIDSSTQTGAGNLPANAIPNTDRELVTVEQALQTHAIRATLKFRFGNWW